MADTDFKLFIEPGLIMTLHDLSVSKWSASLVVPSEKLFHVPYHFHPSSDEYILVISGSLDIVLQGKRHTVTPEMGEFHIPRGNRHSLTSPVGVVTHVMERSSPTPQLHSEMFKDLFAHGAPNTFHALAAFWREGDSVPAVGDVDWTPDIVGKLLVWIVGGFFGNFLGLAPKVKPKTA